MKKYCLVAALLISCASSAQQFTSPCIDSTQTPNPYAPCGTDYEPVCGCDNKTYRNECSAFFWGGLRANNWLTNTVCGNFDFDFYPTAVNYYPATFNLFMKVAGSAVIYIYDDFGRLQYSYYINTYLPGKIDPPLEISVQNFKQGIYCIIVVVGGDKQSKKFAVVHE